MPKEYKYTLGQDALNLCWKCLDETLAANAKPNKDKSAELEKLSASFDQLKLRLRMMQEIGLVSVKQFAHWQDNYLSPLGVELGGWLKWAKSVGGGNIP